MKEKTVFWKILVVCFVGLFLVSWGFYGGTAYCQASEEEEEVVQARPRPDTRPNPMQRMKSSATTQRARPARTTQQMKSSATMQRARPVRTTQQMKSSATMQRARPARQVRPTSSMHK